MRGRCLQASTIHTMPTTRSATKQLRLEDVTPKSPDKAGTKKVSKQSSKPSTKQAEENPPRAPKRKASPDGVKQESPSKRRKGDRDGKQSHFPGNDMTDLEKPIIINRAPVLQLWGACVADFLHPELSWPACLSVGNAISALCATSKGKAIGLVEPKEKSEDERKKREKKKRKAEEDTETVTVMGFPLHLEGGKVLLSGTPKGLNEGTLQAKFGGDGEYGRAKEAMLESLRSWEGDKEGLDKKAFHMYEKFRPTVPQGQRGWGRKGELNLHELVGVVRR